MKRVFFTIAFICLMCVPTFAIERSVWTYTASDEICFELAYVPDEALSIPVEDLTAPVDELDFVDCEESAEHPIEEPDEELTDENN